ncbi:carbohydrate-binding module family 13 protein [Scleroderma yunnanense]
MANIQSNGIYALKNVEADSYLDLSGSDRHSSTYDTVEWQFIHQGYGNFQIKSVADGQYLGIDGPPANGVRVVAVSTPFMWTIQRDPVHSQAIRLYVPGTDLNMELSDQGNPTPGTHVQLWSTFYGHHQIWRFRRV